MDEPSVGPTNETRNGRTLEFRTLFERLPANIQEAAHAAFKRFQENPRHPALRHHALRDTGKGQHRANSFSVTVTMQYRAIYAYEPSPATNLWYWIGSHADYNRMVGSN